LVNPDHRAKQRAEKYTQTDKVQASIHTETAIVFSKSACCAYEFAHNSFLIECGRRSLPLKKTEGWLSG
jgi:hypothetical protein